MKWAKIPTQFLYLPDKEITAIAKYVMLCGTLEREPSESECLRIMSRKQYESIQKYFQNIFKTIYSGINAAKNDRERKKQKSADLCDVQKKIPVENPTESPQENPKTDKIRKDKIENIMYEKIKNFLIQNLSAKHNRQFQGRGWTDEIRKLCELDKIPPDRVMDALRWHFENYDREYRLEIQSAKALRKKFSRLEAQKAKADAKNNEPFYL